MLDLKKVLANLNMNNGISFQEDCMIGANDLLERVICEENLPLMSIARRGYLSEILIILLAAAIFLLLYKKFKK